MSEFVIDKVVLSEKNDCVILSLTQPNPWDEPEVLGTLKTRLGEYIYAVESGFIEREFPETTGKDTVIRIVHYFPISENMLRVIPSIEAALHKKGIGLELLYLKVGY